MTKEDLLKIINERNKKYSTALVSIEEFFEGNNIQGSFAANACNDEIDVPEFYEIFKKLKSLEKVEDIWIMITDIDEEWPYSDTAFISTSLDPEEINTFFGEGFPDEINEVEETDDIIEQIQRVKKGFKLYCLWWD